VTAGLVGGCASPQMSRIDRNRDVYESWPIDTQQAVLDGKVEPGMTPEMVKVAWGEPTRVSQAGTGEEVWVYEKGGSDGSVMYPGGSYPGGMYPGGGINASPGIGIVTGRGIGTQVGATGGIGVGVPIGGANIGMGSGLGGMGGMGGMGGPIVTPPTPAEVKEVVFRDGVVFRADQP
jgi:hypothetical protein